MRVENLTGWPVVIFNADGTEKQRFPLSEYPPPRVTSATPSPVRHLPFPAVEWAEAPRLSWTPPVAEGVVYIVTGAVADLLRGRPDCFTPGLIRRDFADGIGCRRLNRMTPRLTQAELA